jgi:hypothetical protein
MSRPAGRDVLRGAGVAEDRLSWYAFFSQSYFTLVIGAKNKNTGKFFLDLPAQTHGCSSPRPCNQHGNAVRGQKEGHTSNCACRVPIFAHPQPVSYDALEGLT